MSWSDKALKKHKLHKEIDNALNSPEYKEARRKWEEQAVLKAFANFLLITCDFLELKHGYKKNGLSNYLEFANERMGYTEENENYFKEMIQYFKDEIGLDVLRTMGIERVDD